MWVFTIVLPRTHPDVIKLCLNACFVMIFRRIEQVYAGICRVQVLETSKVAVDSYTLGPKNVVVKLFSNTKREKDCRAPSQLV